MSGLPKEIIAKEMIEVGYRALLQKHKGKKRVLVERAHNLLLNLIVDKTEKAFHEAGHAVVQTLFGEEVLTVSIQASDEHAGVTYTQAYPAIFEAYRNYRRPMVYFFKAVAMIAGVAAQSKMLGSTSWEGSAGDLEELDKFLTLGRFKDASNDSDPIGEAVIQAAITVVNNKDIWRCIQKVASGLLLHRTLSGDVVRVIVRRSAKHLFLPRKLPSATIARKNPAVLIKFTESIFA